MYDAKANRIYYLNNGRCPYCGGKNPVEPGKRRCAICGEKSRERYRKRIARRKANGLCTGCGGPLDGDGFRTCKKCRDRPEKWRKLATEVAKRIYDERIASGHCVRCGVHWAEPGKTQCKECLIKHAIRQKAADPGWEKKKAKRQARIDAGLCIDCGRPAQDGKKRCQRCIEKRRDSTRKYKIKQRTKKEVEKARRGL